MAGIAKDTPNPEGGVIEKDPKTGEPTGTLRESASRLVSVHMPPYTEEEQRQGLVEFQKMALADGVTTVHNAALRVRTEGEDSYSSATGVYEKLQESDQLNVRFRGSLVFSPDTKLEAIPAYVRERAQHTGALFQTNTIKIFLDGVIEGVTGYLFEPYAHRPDYRGELLWDPDYLNEACAALDKEGFQIHVHAIGDAAVHLTLNAFEYAQKANGKRDSRNFITHIQLVDDKDKPRFKELGVVGNPQPFWFQKGPYYDNLEVPYLGEERASREYPMQSLIDAGAIMASGSDFPVTIPFTPVVGIEQGVTRLEQGVTDPEQILGPDERASLEDMIASFTINGAYVNFMESITGSLEVGKLADIIVLDRNLFEIPETEISEAKVLMTLFEGEEVYRHPDFGGGQT
jgi:predicted amidohydrolase YtcJ